MRDFVEGFGKVKQDFINLGPVVHSNHPVMDCFNELRFMHKTVLTGIQAGSGE